MNQPDVVILAGGRGTRLRPLVADRPKILAPVNGRPFLVLLIDTLLGAGFGRLHFSAGHLAGSLDQWLREHAPNTLDWTLFTETEALGTAGAVRANLPHVTGDTLLVMNGDSLLPNLDWSGFLQAHRDRGRKLTLAVTPVTKTGRYGTVAFDEQHRLTAFREKAPRDQGWVNGGVYLLARELAETIPADQPGSLESDWFPRWAAQGQAGVFPCPPPLLDMGTPEGLTAMERFLRAEG